MKRKIKRIMKTPGEIIGREGGRATLRKYGKDHFRELVRKRWAKNKKNKEKKDEQ